MKQSYIIYRCSLITVSHPVSPELDAAGRYLAFQPLESYGPCLQKSASEEKELYDLTDGYSVAALKVSIIQTDSGVRTTDVQLAKTVV